MNGLNIPMLMEMTHSALQNYIVPGLESHLLAEPSDKGSVRLFVNSRDQHHHITPHSHRFDFQCLVLRGSVVNTVFHELPPSASVDAFERADEYTTVILEYKGKPGNYDQTHGVISSWGFERHHYAVGDWYSMTFDQVHSIEFSRDAIVLFMEGPKKTNMTQVLLPHVDGQTLPTFEVAPWMFQGKKV